LGNAFLVNSHNEKQIGIKVCRHYPGAICILKVPREAIGYDKREAYDPAGL
jgi:hypothetical protein